MSTSIALGAAAVAAVALLARLVLGVVREHRRQRAERDAAQAAAESATLAWLDDAYWPQVEAAVAGMMAATPAAAPPIITVDATPRIDLSDDRPAAIAS